MPLERTDVTHPLWRKKVDGSLLRHSVTPIPGWVERMWSIRTVFPEPGGRRDPLSQVQLTFDGRSFEGAVTAYKRRGSAAYRLFFEDALRDALAETFVMSNMRDLEARLRLAEGVADDVEDELPFWEFLDIEFDGPARTFWLEAYFRQKPSFPSLFRRLAISPPLKRMRDELAGKSHPRIHKQRWRPRRELDTEIGASNVIYMLIDTAADLFYVGEAAHLVPRLRRGHSLIPRWDYYRYDMLPSVLAPFRLQLERMLIRDIESLIGAAAEDLPKPLSQVRLVNLRIDR
jgi:hypothetical protein